MDVSGTVNASSIPKTSNAFAKGDEFKVRLASGEMGTGSCQKGELAL